MQIEYIEYVPLIVAGFKRFIRIVLFNAQSKDSHDTTEMLDDWHDFAQLADAHECFFNDPYWYDGKCTRWNIWHPLWLHIGEDGCRQVSSMYAYDDAVHYEEFWQAVCDCYFGRTIIATANYSNDDIAA